MLAHAHSARRYSDRKYMVQYLPPSVSSRSGLKILCRAILHDPALYPEPDDFKPERFLNQDGSLRDDPILASAFGYGRRICPGRHFLDTTLFIVVASLFSVFNAERGQDAKDGPLSYSFTGGGVTR